METKTASKDLADTRRSNENFEIAGLRCFNNRRWCNGSRMRFGRLHTRYDLSLSCLLAQIKFYTSTLLLFEGLKTALVEADDFASGTSSRSTKLIHGGVRYLQKAIMQVDVEQYKMVKEALHERASMLESAPHLAHPLPIMLPVYTYVYARMEYKLSVLHVLFHIYFYYFRQMVANSLLLVWH